MRRATDKMDPRLGSKARWKRVMRFLPSQHRWQRHRRERTGRWRTTLYTRDQLNKEALLGVQRKGVIPRGAGVHFPAPIAGGH